MTEQIIIEMTPFIFEDGKTYYFQIFNREYSNDYFDLYVYEKIEEKVRKFFWQKEKTIITFKKLNDKPELVSLSLDADEIKNDIKKVLIVKKAAHSIKGWDGFVGNISNDIKKSLKRDNNINNILGD